MYTTNDELKALRYFMDSGGAMYVSFGPTRDMYHIGNGQWIQEQIEGSLKEATEFALHNIVSNWSLDQCTTELGAAGHYSQISGVQEARDALVAMAMEGWKDELLTKQEAYDLGYDHGFTMAQESGGSEAGCDGWDGMLINADPRFAREKLGWDGQDTSDAAKELMAEYCRGCQDGAEAAVK